MGENSRRSRKLGSRRRINGTAAVSCNAGDFPQVFHRIRETFDVRVARRHGREYGFSCRKSHVSTARDYSSAFMRTIYSRRENLMRSFPEKPQRSAEQHTEHNARTARGEERGKEQRYPWEWGRGSIILCRFERSRVT